MFRPHKKEVDKAWKLVENAKEKEEKYTLDHTIVVYLMGPDN